MRLCTVPLAPRAFDNQTFYSFTEVRVNAEYAQSSTHGRGAERFGVSDPKIKWLVKLPL